MLQHNQDSKLGVPQQQPSSQKPAVDNESSSQSVKKQGLQFDGTNFQEDTIIGQLFNPMPEQVSEITTCIVKKLKQQKNEPWKLLSNVGQLIRYIYQQEKTLYQSAQGYQDKESKWKFKCKGSVYMQNQQNIYIGEGTVIQHGAVIVGPCLIGSNCEIRKGAYLRGNVIIGGKTLIGNSCQLKNSILMDHCQIAHFNYIGDSILGIRAHFSAGSITSNLKLDGSLVKVIKRNNEQVLTDRNKFGALVGHNVEVGCNAILNPGSVIGQNSVIYPLVNWRGSLSRNRICKLNQEHVVVERKSTF